VSNVMGLRGAIKELNRYFAKEGSFACPNKFYTPGFWVVVAVKAKLLRIDQSKFVLPTDILKSYAETMGLAKVIWGVDDCNRARVSEGKGYSPLVLLDNPAIVDNATSILNKCIRELANPDEVPGIEQLCNIVGELHDNVWSHGQATGVSMAQVYGRPGNRTIKFAVADGGRGFLNEMTRAGFANFANCDREAIDWCLMEGHSTKHADLEDDWAQMLPEDALTNPYGKDIQTFTSSNHHQGLGLYKLAKFIKDFNGSMTLVTGSCMMTLDSTGVPRYEVVPCWNGVAISCSLDEQNLKNRTSHENLDSLRSLMSKLQE